MTSLHGATRKEDGPARVVAVTPRPATKNNEKSTSDDGSADTALSYEQARAALAEVVQRLETGGVTLEESLALWERGEALAKICQEWLDGARKRLAAATKPHTEATPGPVAESRHEDA